MIFRYTKKALKYQNTDIIVGIIASWSLKSPESSLDQELNYSADMKTQDKSEKLSLHIFSDYNTHTVVVQISNGKNV